MIFIGVSGHRLITEIDKIKVGISCALSHIEKQFPDEAWSVISSLAEGADRLVVKQIFEVQPSAQLFVPLPLSVSDYLEDFHAIVSKQEFLTIMQHAHQVIVPPPGITRPAGYDWAGRYVIENSQVLIALWDGKKARGQGGTAKIVSRARQRKIPLAWIFCENQIPGTCLTLSPDMRQGKATFERFENLQRVFI